MSASQKLYRLQQIDSQLDQSRTRLQAIDLAINEDSALRQAQQSAHAAEEAHQAARKALRLTEDAVRAQRIKIEQTEATLYGGRVRNPKELQDLQHESASLKKYLGVLEDQQLDAMLAAEEAETAHQQSQAALLQAAGTHSEQTASLKGEQTELLKTVERLDVERQAAVTSIAPDDQALYDRLRQQRRGVAVSKVNVRICSVCGALLNTSIAQAAASPNQISRCPTCGRILYVG